MRTAKLPGNRLALSGALFALDVDLSTSPNGGRKLGDLNGASPGHAFLNIDLHVLFWNPVYGYIELL